MGREIHAFEVVDGHHIVNAAHLQLRVLFRIGSHRWTAIDLQQPCLAITIEDEIESV